MRDVGAAVAVAEAGLEAILMESEQAVARMEESPVGIGAPEK